VTSVVVTVAHEVTPVGFRVSPPLPWRGAVADEGDVPHQ
jgi:hypothetical protein